MDDPIMVEVKDLHFSRGNTDIFRGVDLQIPLGEITAIMGPSGTGKTTLLKSLFAAERPSEGQVLVLGRNVGCLGERAIPALRRRQPNPLRKGE